MRIFCHLSRRLPSTASRRSDPRRPRRMPDSSQRSSWEPETRSSPSSTDPTRELTKVALTLATLGTCKTVETFSVDGGIRRSRRYTEGNHRASLSSEKKNETKFEKRNWIPIIAIPLFAIKPLFDAKLFWQKTNNELNESAMCCVLWRCCGRRTFQHHSKEIVLTRLFLPIIY